MNATIVIIVIIYLLVMLAIGYYSSKKIERNGDFMVVDRRLSPILMVRTL